MVGRYFRCGRDADASDGDVCFVMFHFLIFKLSLTCDESQETGEGIWSGNRPNPFLVLHSSPLREQETCDFLRYKMHSGRGNHAPTQVMLRKRYANWKVCATSQFSVIVKFRINRTSCAGSVRKPNLPGAESVHLFFGSTISF